MDAATDRESCSVIAFLLEKNHKPTEIHQQLCDVYTGVTVSKGEATQLCIMFENGNTNSNDKDCNRLCD